MTQEKVPTLSRPASACSGFRFELCRRCGDVVLIGRNSGCPLCYGSCTRCHQPGNAHCRRLCMIGTVSSNDFCVECGGRPTRRAEFPSCHKQTFPSCNPRSTTRASQATLTKRIFAGHRRGGVL